MISKCCWFRDLSHIRVSYCADQLSRYLLSSPFTRGRSFRVTVRLSDEVICCVKGVVDSGCMRTQSNSFATPLCCWGGLLADNFRRHVHPYGHSGVKLARLAQSWCKLPFMKSPGAVRVSRWSDCLLCGNSSLANSPINIWRPCDSEVVFI